MKHMSPGVHKRRLRPLTAIAVVVTMAWITTGVEGCCDPNNPDCGDDPPPPSVNAAGDWFLEGLFDGADAYLYRLILSQTQAGTVSGDAVQGRFEGIFGGGVPGPIPRPISGSVSGSQLTLLFDWFWDGSQTTVVFTWQEIQGGRFRAGDLILWPCDARATCREWRSR